MALRRYEIAMKFLYVMKLWIDQKAIELQKIPGAPGAYIVSKSTKAVGIATRKKNPLGRVLWGRNDRQIPVGTILVSCWLRIKSPKAKKIFNELERKTQIPNQWIVKGNERYLYVFLFVDDLLHFQRMQSHILGNIQEGYLKEEIQLEMALAELEEQEFSFPKNPSSEEKQVLAQALARVQALFRFCYDNDKAFVAEKATLLGARISAVRAILSNIIPEIEKMVQAIRNRQDSINAISPIIAARQQASKKMIGQYISVIKSTIKMLDSYLEQFTSSTILQSKQTISQALISRASQLELAILCRPARNSARHAVSRMKRASDALKTDDTGSAITELKRARTFLQKSLETIYPTKISEL